MPYRCAHLMDRCEKRYPIITHWWLALHADGRTLAVFNIWDDHYAVAQLWAKWT